LKIIAIANFSSDRYTVAEGLQGVVMKIRSFFAALALALIVALPARAQTPDGFGGCEDSPENPTLILAGLAGGAFAINAMRLRYRARRASEK
jgi:XrtJ-associated TM-motif-TM protein